MNAAKANSAITIKFLRFILHFSSPLWFSQRDTRQTSTPIIVYESLNLQELAGVHKRVYRIKFFMKSAPEKHILSRWEMINLRFSTFKGGLNHRMNRRTHRVEGWERVRGLDSFAGWPFLFGLPRASPAFSQAKHHPLRNVRKNQDITVKPGTSAVVRGPWPGSAPSW